MRVALEEIVVPSTDVVAPWAPRWRNPQTKVVGKVRDVREGQWDNLGHSEGPIKEAKGDESAYPPRIGPSQPTI